MAEEASRPSTQPPLFRSNVRVAPQELERVLKIKPRPGGARELSLTGSTTTQYQLFNIAGLNEGTVQGIRGRGSTFIGDSTFDRFLYQNRHSIQDAGHGGWNLQGAGLNGGCRQYIEELGLDAGHNFFMGYYIHSVAGGRYYALPTANGSSYIGCTAAEIGPRQYIFYQIGPNFTGLKRKEEKSAFEDLMLSCYFFVKCIRDIKQSNPSWNGKIIFSGVSNAIFAGHFRDMKFYGIPLMDYMNAFLLKNLLERPEFAGLSSHLVINNGNITAAFERIMRTPREENRFLEYLRQNQGIFGDLFRLKGAIPEYFEELVSQRIAPGRQWPGLEATTWQQIREQAPASGSSVALPSSAPPVPPALPTKLPVVSESKRPSLLRAPPVATAPAPSSAAPAAPATMTEHTVRGGLAPTFVPASVPSPALVGQKAHAAALDLERIKGELREELRGVIQTGGGQDLFRRKTSIANLVSIFQEDLVGQKTYYDRTLNTMMNLSEARGLTDRPGLPQYLDEVVKYYREEFGFSFLIDNESNRDENGDIRVLDTELLLSDVSMDSLQPGRFLDKEKVKSGLNKGVILASRDHFAFIRMVNGELYLLDSMFGYNWKINEILERLGLPEGTPVHRVPVPQQPVRGRCANGCAFYSIHNLVFNEAILASYRAYVRSGEEGSEDRALTIEKIMVYDKLIKELRSMQEEMGKVEEYNLDVMKRSIIGLFEVYSPEIRRIINERVENIKSSKTLTAAINFFDIELANKLKWLDNPRGGSEVGINLFSVVGQELQPRESLAEGERGGVVNVKEIGVESGSGENVYRTESHKVSCSTADGRVSNVFVSWEYFNPDNEAVAPVSSENEEAELSGIANESSSNPAGFDDDFTRRVEQEAISKSAQSGLIAMVSDFNDPGKKKVSIRLLGQCNITEKRIIIKTSYKPLVIKFDAEGETYVHIREEDGTDRETTADEKRLIHEMLDIPEKIMLGETQPPSHVGTLETKRAALAQPVTAGGISAYI